MLTMALAGLAFGVSAQIEPGRKSAADNAPEAFVQNEKTISEDRDIRSMINDFLSSKKWHEGKNTGKDGNEFFIATGTAGIDAPRAHQAYISSRVAAYDKAMMAAKSEMAKYIKTGVSSGAESTSAEDKDGGQATFCKIIKTETRQYILGMQVLCSFEYTPAGKNGEIGVIAVWSPRLQRMAEALATGKPVENGMPRKPLNEQISSDPLVLMTTFGIQQRLDEKGNPALVAFGQDGALRDSTRSAEAARRKAQMNAHAAIREFAGESVAVESIKMNAETLKEFNEAASQYSNDNAFEDRITTFAKEMNISGIATLKHWQAKHPISGQMVYGVVCIWSPELSKQANTLGDILAGKGKTTSLPAAQKTAPKVEPGKSFSGTGQSADETAF